MDYLFFFSIITAISTLSLSYLIVKGLYWLWLKPKSIEKHLRKQGINGTAYKLFYGDVKEFKKSLTNAKSRPLDLNHRIVSYVLPYVVETTKNFGDMCFYWMFTTPKIIIQEPELIREALMKSDTLVPLPLPPSKRVAAGGLTALSGDKWFQHRSIINPAFHLEKLKAMVPEFSTCCAKMVDRWNRLIGSDGSCKLDVWLELSSMASDVISRVAFGSGYTEGKILFELQEQQMDLISKPERYPFIPGIRFLPTEENRKSRQLHREIDGMIATLIHKKEKAMKLDDNGHNDLLGIMLHSNEQAKKNACGAKLKGMTLREIMDECKLFYLAGHDTTAGLLTWTMVLLSMNPSWQNRARDEVQRICGRNIPNYESINQFKIVNMILLEVLRLYPPLPAHLRRTICETKLRNISLPADVELILPSLVIHHDKKIWGDDAEEFNPERFSEGISNATKNKFSYFPFGWGPKICIGQNFAMIEAKIAMAMILQNFEFELSSSYIHSLCTIPMIRPVGAPLIIKKLA